VSHDSTVDGDWLPVTGWCHHYADMTLSYRRREQFGGGVLVWYRAFRPEERIWIDSN